MKSQSPDGKPVSTARRRKTQKKQPVGGNGELIVFTVGGEDRVGYIQDGKVVSDSRVFPISKVNTVINKVILLIYALSSLYPRYWTIWN